MTAAAGSGQEAEPPVAWCTFNPNLAPGTRLWLAVAGPPVYQGRGQLAGRVAGHCSESSISFFALNLIWNYSTL